MLIFSSLGIVVSCLWILNSSYAHLCPFQIMFSFSMDKCPPILGSYLDSFYWIWPVYFQSCFFLTICSLCTSPLLIRCPVDVIKLLKSYIFFKGKRWTFTASRFRDFQTLKSWSKCHCFQNLRISKSQNLSKLLFLINLEPLHITSFDQVSSRCHKIAQIVHFFKRKTMNFYCVSISRFSDFGILIKISESQNLRISESQNLRIWESEDLRISEPQNPRISEL